MEKYTFEIPYRLETSEAVSEAMRINLLNLEKHFKVMKTIASRKKLHLPDAFKLAKKEVIKEFVVVKEDKISERNVTYEEIANLQPVECFLLMKEQIPWIHEVMNHRSVSSLFAECTGKSSNLMKISSPYSTFDMILAERKFMRSEILAYIRKKSPNHLTTDNLKKLLVAHTLFDPRNDDLLFVFENDLANNADRISYQNALAELLFSRLQKKTKEFITIDLKTIKQKLSKKIMGLTDNANIKLALLAPLSISNMSKDLISTLKKISGLSQRIHAPDEIKQKLHSYIEAIISTITKRQDVYKELFLEKELEGLQKLYTPAKVVGTKVSYSYTIFRKYTIVDTLRLFPTKDYLDYCKGIKSHDCTMDKFAEDHLFTTNFFNIRIFKNDNWIGNMYMLDFIKGCGVILIDRIQIPRGINIKYINFFNNLKEALQDMFQDVDYREILIAQTVSNHSSVQTAFNDYKKKLEVGSRNGLPRWDQFESLSKKQTLFVLCEKEKVVNRGL